MKSYHGCCSPHTAHHICCHGCCSPHHGCPHQSPLFLKCQHLHTITAGLYPALTPLSLLDMALSTTIHWKNACCVERNASR